MILLFFFFSSQEFLTFLMLYKTNYLQYPLKRICGKNAKFFLPRILILLSTTDQDLIFDSGLGQSLRSDSQVMTKITILSSTWSSLESRSNIEVFLYDAKIIVNDLILAQASLLNERDRNSFVNKNKETGSSPQNQKQKVKNVNYPLFASVM